jgi:hypothetical protein
MTTFGDMVFQMGGVPVNPGIPFGIASRPIFVAPHRSGSENGASDGNDGKTPKRSVKTLSKALSLAREDKNDVVFQIASGNSAAETTDDLSTALDWNKDGVHLIGINAGSFMGQRSRIAQLSTVLTIDSLFTVSASNCFISNIHIFQGVGSSTATTPIALEVTGERNRFHNCHIAGIGDDSMDVAAAKTLYLNGAAETIFDKCVIGLDTVTRGTATSEMLCANAVTRVKFVDCLFPTFAAASGFTFLDTSAAGALDRFLWFKNCLFHNAVESTATEMTEAFDTGASQGGTIVIDNCGLVGVGAAAWDASTDGVVYNITPDPGADGDGGHAEPVD